MGAYIGRAERGAGRHIEPADAQQRGTLCPIRQNIARTPMVTRMYPRRPAYDRARSWGCHRSPIEKQGGHGNRTARQTIASWSIALLPRQAAPRHRGFCRAVLRPALRRVRLIVVSNLNLIAERELCVRPQSARAWRALAMPPAPHGRCQASQLRPRRCSRRAASAPCVASPQWGGDKGGSSFIVGSMSRGKTLRCRAI